MARTSLSPSGADAPAARPAGFLLMASITISFLAGSSAPTPLYTVYQELWGFSPATLLPPGARRSSPARTPWT